MIIDTYVLMLLKDFHNFLFVYYNKSINILFDDYMLN